MGRFNTYQSDLKYTPQSFEKLALLPMQLRKEHDAAENNIDLIGTNIAETKVSAGFQDQYNAKKADFDAKSKDLASRLAKEGAGKIELMNEFKSIKRQYNQDASATGVFGLGARNFKEEKEAEKVYTEVGAKMNQSAERVALKWKEGLEERNNAIREGYAKDPNFVPSEMVHKFAPPKYEMVDFALKVKDLIGSEKWSETGDKLLPNQLFESLGVDASGQMQINTHSYGYEKNRPQLEAFAKLLNAELYNPMSDIRKHMDYNGISIADYLKTVDPLIETMNVKSEATVDKINTVGGGSGGSNTNPSTEAESPEGSLMPIHQVGDDLTAKIKGYNGGQPFSLTPGNASIHKANFDALEERNDPVINDPQYNSTKSRVIAMAIKEAEIEALHKGYKSEAYNSFFKDKVMPVMAGIEMYNTGQKYSDGKPIMDTRMKRQTKDYAEVEKDLNTARKWLNDNVKSGRKTVYFQGSETPIETVAKILSDQEAEINDGIAQYYSDDVNKHLLSSTNYTFKSDAKSKAMRDGLDSYVTLEINKILQEASGTGSKVYNDVPGTPNMEPEDISVLQAKGAPASVSVDSITTTGISGFPGIRLKISHKNKDVTTNSYLDLSFDDSEGKANFSREIYNNILRNTKDPETRALMYNGLENAKAMRITSDSVRDLGKGWSWGQNKQIVTEAISSGLKNQTVNSDGTKSYQSIQDENGYYGIGIGPALGNKSKPDPKTFRMYNVQDFINDRVDAVDPNIKENQYKAKAAQINLFMAANMNEEPSKAFGAGVMRPSRSGNDRQIMFEALKEYQEQMEAHKADTSKGIPHATEMVIAKNFLKKVANIGIMSKSKLMFVAGNREDSN